jgi:hypothetical protein
MVNEWNDFLPPLRGPRKVKVKKVLAPGKYDLRKLYIEAHEYNFKTRTPLAYEAGHYFKPDFPKIDTTNGHKLYMKNCLNWLGHSADNRDTMGVPMLDKFGRPLLDKKGKIRYRKSGSTTGGTDMVNDIFVPGYPAAFSWKIEVKNLDTMGKAQINYQAKMARAGVLHSIIRVGELDVFWDEYYRILNL